MTASGDDVVLGGRLGASLRVELDQQVDGSWVAWAEWLDEVAVGNTAEEAYWEAMKRWPG
jgi:hypothetical protein